MLKNILLVALLFSANSFATPDFGKELQLATNPQDGHYQLGISYSYDSGSMGEKFNITWGILFTTTLSQQAL